MINLDKVTIVVTLSWKRNLLISIPDWDVVMTINSIKWMCNWLYDEFIRDCNVSYKVDKYWDHELSHKNISRIISYTNHTYILNWILIRLYKDTCENLWKFFHLDINELVSKYRDFENDFENIKMFRNKVSAYTVYSKPWDVDNISDEFASLSLFSSWWISPNDSTSFRVWWAQRVVEWIDPNHWEYYSFCLRDEHQKMIKYFNKWGKLFCNLIKSVEWKLPISGKSFILNKDKYEMFAKIIN